MGKRGVIGEREIKEAKEEERKREQWKILPVWLDGSWPHHRDGSSHGRCGRSDERQTFLAHENKMVYFRVNMSPYSSFKTTLRRVLNINVKQKGAKSNCSFANSDLAKLKKVIFTRQTQQ